MEKESPSSLEYIDQQVFSQEDCSLIKEQKYVKDLFLVKNRHLKDILMVDYKCQSFGFNLSNGVFLPHWNGSPEEDVLMGYAEYLTLLAKEDDCRPLNLKMMGYKQLYNEIDSTEVS